MTPIENMTRGGDGSHWAGCEDTHWDCCIVALRIRIKPLEHDLDRYRAWNQTLQRELSACRVLVEELKKCATVTTRPEFVTIPQIKAAKKRARRAARGKGRP